ncbi:hypothetical protein ACWFRQ_19150 [Streptomyces niveus]
MATDKFWGDTYRRDVFQYAVNYYIDASVGGPIELASSTFQAGLELLSWAVLVEESQELSPSEYKSSRNPAHSLIDRMLTRYGIDTSIPGHMASLSNAAILDAANPCRNGPEVLTRMRNGVIHPKRRIGARSYDIDSWVDAWQLSQQYLLLATLAYVEYSGAYRSPMATNVYAGVVDTVPWAI